MAKEIDEKIGARSQKNWHGLKYKNPLKNYRVHEMPTGDNCPRNTDCPKKNYNRHLGIDCKRTLYGIRKIKPDYETMTIFLQFSEDPTLIWPNNHKEIWIFVKQVIGSFLPSFVT